MITLSALNAGELAVILHGLMYFLQEDEGIVSQPNAVLVIYSTGLPVKFHLTLDPTP
jgi:hypothetical protein